MEAFSWFADYIDLAVEFVIDRWLPFVIVLMIAAVTAIAVFVHTNSHEVCSTVERVACVNTGGWMGGVQCRVVGINGKRLTRHSVTLSGDRFCWRESNQ